MIERIEVFITDEGYFFPCEDASNEERELIHSICEYPHGRVTKKQYWSNRLRI